MDIVFLFYDGMTALDAIGPYEVFSRTPGATIKCAAIRPGKIQARGGLILTAEHDIKDVNSADILCLPGAGNAASLKNHPEILHWVRDIHQTTRWTTSVCTGSLILGASGLLLGVKATTHWAVLERLRKWGAYPQEDRVVEDGKIITAAGVSAGIDMALILTAKIFGVDEARSLQLAIEYEPEPPFVGSPRKADKQLVDKLLAKMVLLFEKP